LSHGRRRCATGARNLRGREQCDLPATTHLRPRAARSPARRGPGCPTATTRSRAPTPRSNSCSGRCTGGQASPCCASGSCSADPPAPPLPCQSRCSYRPCCGTAGQPGCCRACQKLARTASAPHAFGSMTLQYRRSRRWRSSRRGRRRRDRPCRRPRSGVPVLAGAVEGFSIVRSRCAGHVLAGQLGNPPRYAESPVPSWPPSTCWPPCRTGCWPPVDRPRGC